MNTLAKKPKSIQVLDARNPFKKHEGELLTLPHKGATLAELHQQVVTRDIPVAASINGVIIAPEAWAITVPAQGDYVVFVPILRGGDDGGKSVLSIFAFIAILLVAPYLAGALLPGVATTSALYMAVNATIMVVGGVLVSSLLAPTAPKTPSMDALSSSQTYGWNPATKQQQGTCKPRFYGKNKVYGNVVTAYTSTDEADATKQTMNIALALGHGPIKGITQADGINYDITINDQPAQYYDDIVMDVKLGTNLQTVLSPGGIDIIPTPEYRPNRKVVYGTPYIYSVPDTDYSSLEIELAFPRGVYNATTGPPASHTVDYQVDIRESSGAWVTLVADSFSDSRVQGLLISFLNTETYTGGAAVPITRGTKYEIRVQKTTTDKGVTYGDELRLHAVREILGTGFTSPLTALLGVRALATSQLAGALQVTCILEGSVVDVYDGTVWSVEYSENPAWVLWDVLTDPIITGESAGNYVVNSYRGMDPLLSDATPRLDLESFYLLAAFCDTLVDDGAGGTEKRITFNGGFDVEFTRWEAALKVAEVARCALIWNGSTISVVVDKSEVPSALFTVANIHKDSFKETYLSTTDRASEVEVSYRDQYQDYERVPFTVYDADAGNPANKVTLELMGTTKRSEAWRAAKYRLLQNKLLIRTIQWDADIDAISTAIGRVVWFQHDVPQWGIGGRVVASDASTITMDKDATIPGGETWKVLVRTYDPITEAEVYSERTILSIVDRVVTVDTVFTVLPTANDIYTVGLSTLYALKVRITKISRKSDLTATIHAIEYNEDVYSAEGDVEIPDINYTAPDSQGRHVIDRPTRRELNTRFASIVNTIPKGVTFDVPMPYNILITDASPTATEVAWTADNGTLPITVVYRGTSYTITPSHSAKKYIYWKLASPTAFYSTDSEATALAAGNWIMVFNEAGVATLVFGRKLIHGGLIQADTITASQIVSIDASQVDNLPGSTPGEIDSFAKLMLHFDGEDAAVVTTDDSLVPHTVSFVGDAQLDTTQKKFGDSSLLLDGTGDYLTVPGSDDWAFGSSDWTIDCCIRFTVLQTCALCSQWVSATDRWYVLFVYIANTIRVYFRVSDTGVALYDFDFSTVSINTDYHIALVRNGTSIDCYVDGTALSKTVTIAVATNDLSTPGAALFIGNIALTSNFFSGWIDEFRISKGIARWTTDFTPKTSAYILSGDGTGTIVDGWKKTGTTKIQGGQIETDSLSAISANLGNITSGEIILSLGGNTRLRIDTNGLYVSNNSGTDWSEVIKNDSGTVKMYADILEVGEIITEKLADNAAAISQSSETAGAVTLGSSLTTIQTLSTFPSEGNTIQVMGSVRIDSKGSFTDSVVISLYRGSTKIWESSDLTVSPSADFYVTLSTIDTPGAGNQTYYIKCLAVAGGRAEAKERKLYCEETKK